MRGPGGLRESLPPGMMQNHRHLTRRTEGPGQWWPNTRLPSTCETPIEDPFILEGLSVGYFPVAVLNAQDQGSLEKSLFGLVVPEG